MELWTLADYANLLRSPFGAEVCSAVSGRALVVVDLDQPPVDLSDVAPTFEHLPAVVVGVGDRPDALGVVDTWISDLAALEAIETVVNAHPLAATSLALQLRGGTRRSISDGLVAESSTYSTLQSGTEFRSWRQTRAGRPPVPEVEAAVEIRRDGQQLTITLNRPARHNAVNAALRDALSDALQVALANPDLRVELRGNGPSFCSGGDLDEFGSFPDPARAHLIRLTRSPAAMLSRLAPRLTTHLHGSCLGAGIEWAAFSGVVTAHPDASIGLPEVALGLVPGAGGTVSLPRRIGRHRTALLALSGTTISAETARQWGLVDQITA
jgi:hypothetical protein